MVIYGGGEEVDWGDEMGFRRGCGVRMMGDDND